MNSIQGDVVSRFAYRNPLDLPRISYADIVGNTAEGVYVEEPGMERVFHRAPPLFHDDPSGAGLFQPFDRLQVTYPPVFTVSLRDATVVGYRSVLSREGFLTNDLGHLTPESVRSFAGSLGKSGEIAHLTPLGNQGEFSHAVDEQKAVLLRGPVVLLTSAEAGNFGSFLYRELVKLVNLGTIPDNWRFLLHIGGKTYEEFLELAGLPMARVIRHDPRTVYRIDQAIIPGLRTPFALADPPTRAFYDALRSRCETKASGRRLYISRRSLAGARPAGRVMLNESELIEALRPLGFVIVEPQALTATEQVALFASAELVVGPSGSGMFNAVFCRPSTKLIDIESEPHWVYPHSSLFASAGLQYGIFEGLAADRDWSVHHKPWQVDIAALLGRIASFAPPGASTTVALPAAGPTMWSAPPLTGEDYRTVLQRLHRAFNPANYLEIGAGDGATMELATCPSIGIDPAFRVERPLVDNKPFCCLYKMTSDAFFDLHDPSLIFGRPIEMAFLDGMHWFEFLLRDFINVERHCRSNSVVLLHDCMPTDEYVARRDPNRTHLRDSSSHPDWWAGDVWKVVAILRKYRPELQISPFNAGPTGLVAVTNVNPSSTILSERYFDIVAEFRRQSLSDSGHFDGLAILDTRDFVSLESLSTLFWL